MAAASPCRKLANPCSSDGKTHDVNALDVLAPEPGAFYLFDRGCTGFAALHVQHEASSFLIIRAKRGLRFMRQYSHRVDRIKTKVLCGQTGTLAQHPCS